MNSSHSSFPNANKFQVLPNSAKLVFTQPVNNNNLTINNIGNATQTIRQANTQGGTFIQQPQQQLVSGGTITAPMSIVRLNQPLSTSNQFTSPTFWTNNATQLSPKAQFSPTIQKDSTPSIIQQTSSIMPTKIVAQPVVRQTVTAQPTQKFTDAQINDFVGKCRTFLITLLRLAEKQAPEKLPMVRSCIQDLLDGTIDPESFTERLHTLYKSQPHTSLVPFFRLALPHMRQKVKNAFGRPITIELLEKLNVPSSKTNPPNTTSTSTPSRVIVNPSLLSQQSTSSPHQQLLCTTVQTQQKINLLQSTTQPTLITSTTSLLGQQQQQQQQARTQISLRPIIASVSPSSNTNLLTGQTQIQPISQTIIQPTDSLLQKTTFLSPSTTTIHQPQIITVNHQPIKTDIITTQPSSLINSSSLQQQQQVHIQQKSTIIKTEDDSVDDIIGSNSLLTSAAIDDRHTRHITHDDRLLSATILRRRFDNMIKKDKRWEGSHLTIHDDAVFALISHAAENRLKSLLEQMKSIAQQRRNTSIETSHLTEPSQEITNNNEDTKNKRKFDEVRNTDQSYTNGFSPNKKMKLKKRRSRATLQDLILTMEQDKHLRRSIVLAKALDKVS